MTIAAPATTLRELARLAAVRLEAAGIDEAGLEAEVLARHAAGVDRAAYFAGTLANDEVAGRFAELIELRLTGVPAAYVAGVREFWGLPIAVSPAVLVPRPETELLVEIVIAAARAGDVVADIGTGSGCIAAAVARERTDVFVLAVELTEAATTVARDNFARLAPRVHLVRGDLASAVGRADIVVANLPYVPTRRIATLAAEVQHEPRVALDGGPDGTGLIGRLIADCAARLRPRLAILEVDASHAAAVAARARTADGTATVRHDLAGLERVVVARWD